MLADRLINGFIFLLTMWALAQCFIVDGKWNWQNGRMALRFFTVLSNLFCALACLLVAVTLPELPRWVWLMKYVAVCAVTVTFLTVMFFLGPAIGYKVLLTGRDFYLHLAGPLLALFSFCCLERFFPLPVSVSMLGIIPVFLYGFLYLCKVVIRKQWEDFYGYNKNGKWPISMAAMFAGSFVVSLLVRCLYYL
jgi:hypothetical protein